MKNKIELTVYSDILCFWAYVSQIRLDELKQHFGNQVEIAHHFISVFGDTQDRIGKGWKERGGYSGFSRHIVEESSAFPHVTVNPDIWRKTRPETSATSHLFLKAVQQLLADDNELFEKVLWNVRCAFFERALDIGRLEVLLNIAGEHSLPVSEIEAAMYDGTALAALMTDMEMKQALKLEGSPSYVLNEGRQKLYGNVGYRVIEANVTELLGKEKNQLSWC